MPTIVDRLYREYCRARLAEMRKQLLISAEKHEVLKAIRGTNVAIGANPTVGGETATRHELLSH
jgi:hypothetical protein